MDPFTKNDQRAIIAEFLGTMFFVFLGTGAIVATLAFESGLGALTAGSLVVIGLAHGIGMLAAVAWTGTISGGHINPAVTLAMMLTKTINPVLGAAYMVAQFAGAGVGSLLLKLVTGDAFEGDGPGALGGTTINDAISTGEALGLEIILTAFLVLVIYHTAVSKKGWGFNAPIAIGLAVAAIYFVGLPWTGASVNPARSFGPALVTGEWGDFWVYLVGPAIGTVVVAGAWTIWKNLGDSLDPDDDIDADTSGAMAEALGKD